MKVAHVVPGSGDTFYCQNCLRDSALVPALRSLGLDVILVPMYLPILSKEAAQETPVFFGALNVYLQQKSSLFRRTPRWLDRLFDSKKLLGLIGRKASSTRASGLEEMTLSMLAGEDGRQAKELDRLVSWLRTDIRPDIVHLSNALLLGLAARMKRELGCAVVCSLQDEDGWVDAMEPGAARRVWREMGEKAADVDAFVAVSRYYGEKMRERMRIPASKLHTVYLGIALEGHEAGPLPFDPPVIGYVSRLAESLGLGILVDAFLRLKSEDRFGALRLRATGGQTGSDKAFLSDLARRLAAAGAGADVDFVPDFDRAGRVKFMNSITVLSVPVPGGDAFGMYLLEAMASGVPVAQPKAGAFPEIIEATGGGILYEPNDAEALAAAIASLLDDPGHARGVGGRGRETVFRRFGVRDMARNMAAVYEGCIKTEGSRPGESQ